jgi:hypothetical protein
MFVAHNDDDFGLASRVSFVIAANRLAGLPIAPDTSYRRTLRYFVRAGLHGSSSFPESLCRLRFEKIGLSITLITLATGGATPVNCTFRPMAVVTGSRWHTHGERPPCRRAAGVIAPHLPAGVQHPGRFR